MKKLYTALAFMALMLANQAFGQIDLVITEINYNGPESGTDTTEFIEIYNNGSSTVDLSGYTMAGVTYTFPAGSMLAAGSYAVVAYDSVAMVNTFGYIGAYEWTSGGLSNGGEGIAIYDATSNLMDTVFYDDAAPFPVGASAGLPDGGGATLVLCDPLSDNNDGANWMPSTSSVGINVNGMDVYASPGALDNACIASATPDLVITEIFYNGPESGTDSTEFIEIYNNDMTTADLSGYTFSSGVTFTFPSGVTLASGDYVVVAVDSMAMINTFGYVGAYECIGGLSNAGEPITLEDGLGNIVDSVNYDDASPFPFGSLAGQPDGGGTSIVICDPTSDNNNGINWVVSSTDAGININGFDVYASPGAADMCMPTVPNLVISEINYNGPESGSDTTEFIEIYNNESFTVDVSGFSFSSGVILTFPANTTIPAGGYLVACESSSAMLNTYGYSGAIQWSSGALGNTGEAITIVDRVGQIVDTVDYSDSAPWPSGAGAGEPDGGGASIVICDYMLDNNDGANWNAAGTAVGVSINGFDLYGSPGSINNCCSVTYSTDTRFSCSPITWIDGMEYTTSNSTATFTLQNANGCDSIITLDFTVVDQFPVGTTFTGADMCEGDSTMINLSMSSQGFTYYLRDDANDTIVVGPVTGTGSGLDFAVGGFTSAMTYNIYAEEDYSTFAINLPYDSADYVEFATPFTAYTNEITVEAWIYSDGVEQPWAGQGTYMVDNMGTNVWLWHAGTFYVNNGGSWIALTLPALSAGWTHVSTVADASGMYAYYNGVQVANNTSGVTSTILNNPGSVIHLGHDVRFDANLNGRNSQTAFADFRVWNVARTGTDIMNDMNTCLLGSETGLVQYSKFVEGGGNTGYATAGVDGMIYNGDWMVRTEGSCATGSCMGEFTSTVTISILAATTGSETMTACGSYTWANNGMTYSTSGTYYDTLMNSVGCDSVVTLNLTINSLPTITTTTAQETITADLTGATYQWLDCDNSNSAISGATSQSYTATANGNYAVEITANGCTDTSACVSIASVGILESTFGNTLNVYPNPTNGKIFVEFTEVQSVTLKLMNVSGQVIETRTYGENTIVTYEVEQPAGVYFLEVTNANDDKAIFQVIKQ